MHTRVIEDVLNKDQRERNHDKHVDQRQRCWGLNHFGFGGKHKNASFDDKEEKKKLLATFDL